MKFLFVINITTKEKWGDGDTTLFTEDGDMVGRTLSYHKNEVDPNNVFYSFDIETDEDMYEKLKSGEIKLHHIKEYYVSKSNIAYYRD